MKPELAFTYDADMRPIAAKCTACREVMPAPPANLHGAVDLISWFSAFFLEHKRLKHSSPPSSEAVDDKDAQ
jgi:hypothetical protein